MFTYFIAQQSDKFIWVAELRKALKIITNVIFITLENLSNLAILVLQLKVNNPALAKIIGLQAKKRNLVSVHILNKYDLNNNKKFF